MTSFCLQSKENRVGHVSKEKSNQKFFLNISLSNETMFITSIHVFVLQLFNDLICSSLRADSTDHPSDLQTTVTSSAET